MPINKRFIGISQRLIENNTYYEIRESLALDWGKFFNNEKLLSNFLPLPLSYQINFKEYANCLSGVILSGGNDLSSINDNVLSKQRDLYEIDIIEHCMRFNLPLLGICRGAQLIAYYYQSIIKPCNNHLKKHIVYMDNKSYVVNSFHHYCIKEVNASLEVLAKSSDGTIEAFKHKNFPFFGIMWHIEREYAPKNTILLKEWINLL